MSKKRIDSNLAKLEGWIFEHIDTEDLSNQNELDNAIRELGEREDSKSIKKYPEWRTKKSAGGAVEYNATLKEFDRKKTDIRTKITNIQTESELIEIERQNQNLKGDYKELSDQLIEQRKTELAGKSIEKFKSSADNVNNQQDLAQLEEDINNYEGDTKREAQRIYEKAQEKYSSKAKEDYLRDINNAQSTSELGRIRFKNDRYLTDEDIQEVDQQWRDKSKTLNTIQFQ